MVFLFECLFFVFVSLLIVLPFFAFAYGLVAQCYVAPLGVVLADTALWFTALSSWCCAGETSRLWILLRIALVLSLFALSHVVFFFVYINAVRFLLQSVLCMYLQHAYNVEHTRVTV